MCVCNRVTSCKVFNSLSIVDLPGGGCLFSPFAAVVNSLPH